MRAACGAGRGAVCGAGLRRALQKLWRCSMAPGIGVCAGKHAYQRRARRIAAHRGRMRDRAAIGDAGGMIVKRPGRTVTRRGLVSLCTRVRAPCAAKYAARAADESSELALILAIRRKIFCQSGIFEIMRHMDRLDRKILSVLQGNARASLQEIGQAVGLSPSPCWGRIKKMEEAGVIEGYTVRLNPRALDLADTVLVMVTLDSHSDNTLEKFGETLASIPEVIEAHLVSGDYDYLLRVVVKDTRDYERLLREKLYKIKGIRHSRSSFVLRTLKKADLPLFVD